SKTDGKGSGSAHGRDIAAYCHGGRSAGRPPFAGAVERRRGGGSVAPGTGRRVRGWPLHADAARRRRRSGGPAPRGSRPGPLRAGGGGTGAAEGIGADGTRRRGRRGSGPVMRVRRQTPGRLRRAARGLSRGRLRRLSGAGAVPSSGRFHPLPAGTREGGTPRGAAGGRAGAAAGAAVRTVHRPAPGVARTSGKPRTGGACVPLRRTGIPPV